MPSLDVEDVYETDSSDNEENYSKLLNSVSQLDSTQRIKPAQRKEIASEISEYNLNKGLPNGKNLVNVRELVEVLGKKPEHGIITDRIKKVTKKSNVLCKPLEKPIEERIKRTVGFEKVKKELRKWDAIVTRNALKDQIIFPLNHKSMKMEKSNEFLSHFKTPTPLDAQIAKVLKVEEEEKEKNKSDDEEFPLTFDEMMEKRKEMAQLRARLSYKQTKAQRQSKIKSKKYHRLLKRDKLKQQLKEFESLQKTDPEAALKKLAELDKTRAVERASLRHRNTGKWAKNLSVKAKYDVETRKVLAEQLKMSRELTQKVSQADSSGDEETVDPVLPEKVASSTQNATAKPSTDNPWMLDVSAEVQEFVSDYKKFWSEKGEEISPNEPKEKEKGCNNTSVAESDDLIQSKETSVDKKEIQKSKKREHSPEVESPKISPKEMEISIKKTKIIPDKTEVNSKKAKVSLNKTKISPKRKKTSLNIYSTSGVWMVTPITDEPDTEIESKNKSNDIDTLFDELNDKLLDKATEKIQKIKNKIHRTENEEKRERKKKSKTEFDLSLKNTNVIERPDADVGLLEGGVENDVSVTVSENPNANISTSETAPSIDPKNYIQIKPKRLNTYLPENITGGEDAIDNEKAQQMIIEEAFGDDDVMAEFNKMKEEEEKNSKIEIETSLPGWGQWGGSGIEQNSRKKRLLVVNLPPRKDKLKKDVIINEEENPNLKNHLVKEVPHPFKSVDAFEANIRAPVGRDWVPETAHQKIIQKQVVTKLGTIIEPMSEDEIINLKKAAKSPYQGKKKKIQNFKNN